MFTWVWWIYSLPWLIWAVILLLHFSWSTFFTCLSLAGHQGTNWCSAEEETNVVFCQSSPRRTSSLLGVHLIVSSTRSSQYIKLWATAGPYWQNFFLQFFSVQRKSRNQSFERPFSIFSRSWSRSSCSSSWWSWGWEVVLWVNSIIARQSSCLPAYISSSSSLSHYHRPIFMFSSSFLDAIASPSTSVSGWVIVSDWR